MTFLDQTVFKKKILTSKRLLGWLALKFDVGGRSTALELFYLEAPGKFPKPSNILSRDLCPESLQDVRSVGSQIQLQAELQSIIITDSQQREST